MSTRYVLHHPVLLSFFETLSHLVWFKQWVRKGRRRCKTLIFVTNDYLQNRVLLQPHLTSKHIQYSMMLPSWLTTELEVKLTWSICNSFPLLQLLTEACQPIFSPCTERAMGPEAQKPLTVLHPGWPRAAHTFRGIPLQEWTQKTAQLRLIKDILRALKGVSHKTRLT